MQSARRKHAISTVRARQHKQSKQRLLYHMSACVDHLPPSLTAPQGPEEPKTREQDVPEQLSSSGCLLAKVAQTRPPYAKRSLAHIINYIMSFKELFWYNQCCHSETLARAHVSVRCLHCSDMRKEQLQVCTALIAISRGFSSKRHPKCLSTKG